MAHSSVTAKETNNEKRHRVSNMYHISKSQNHRRCREIIAKSGTFFSIHSRRTSHATQRLQFVPKCRRKPRSLLFLPTRKTKSTSMCRDFTDSKNWVQPITWKFLPECRCQRFVTFIGKLKEDSPPQKQGHDIAIETMLSAPTSGTILNFYCGAGKTVLAVAIAVTRGVRTPRFGSHRRSVGTVDRQDFQIRTEGFDRTDTTKHVRYSGKGFRRRHDTIHRESRLSGK